MADPSTRTEHRKRRQRRRFTLLVAVVILLVVAAAGIFLVTRDDESPAAAPAPTTASIPKASTGLSASFAPAPWRSATTKGADIPVYASPDAAAAPVSTLSAQTEYTLPRSFLAFDQYQDWLHVYLPTRPNDATAWVKASDVNVSNPLEYAVRVSLADHKLWVLHNGVVELTADVAIGMPQYPTPTGTFYFTDPVDLHSQPNSAYGVFAYGLSGHSNVLTEFGGGDGQIANHGTNDPSGIGHDVSHGCVRVLNEVIEQISKLPLGTPVYIT